MECRDFDHEEVIVRRDKRIGLTAVFALHSTTLGAAAGGCRRWVYASVAEAVDDALRLAEGMTYKNALAGIPFGGGKSVIISDGSEPTVRQLERYAEWLNELHGRYVTAEDVGMGVNEIRAIANKSVYVSGLGRGGLGGDPSPKTAYGVFVGLKKAVELRLGRDTLQGLRVGVQGLGSVGMRLSQWLARAGADLVVADLDPNRVALAQKRYGATMVPADEIVGCELDVFAPCALGGVVTADVARTIKAKVIAGAANNQLADASVGDVLRKRGVLYAPDFVINSGGVISVAHEYLVGRCYFDTTHDPESWVGARVEGIADRLQSIVEESTQRNISTEVVAKARALEIVENPGDLLAA